uniref:CCHC-type domain-containing protein n=1 Tax=Escallonia herrerae TaxID=1293975 RepID=A0AA88VP04_9ASTE|nr:hypothetical protein RJ639_009559 [Escallonia herrerae]
MAEEGKGKIEKFNGMNFQWWKMQVEDYLYQKDLYLPLVGEKPEAMNASEWAILDRKALATTIGDGISSSTALSVESRGRQNNKQNNRGRSPTRGRSRSRSRGKSKSKGKTIVCWNCNKEGHKKNDCTEPKKKKGAGGRQSDDEGANMVSSNEWTYDDLCLSATVDDNSKVWYVDSGASIHCTPHRDCFSNYVHGDYGHVTVGNGYRCNIIGKEKVKIKLSNGGTLVLKDVRHIPELQKNLISVSGLDREGYFVAFGEKQWKVTKGSMVVARGERVGTLYTLSGKWLGRRMNRTIMERARCMRIHADLPLQFWAAAVDTAIYLINRSPASALNGGIPEEEWSGKPVNYSFLRVFRCIAYAHIDKEEMKKLDSKSQKCVFIGYGGDEYGYHLWDYEHNKIIRSRDVIFDESRLYKHKLQEHGIEKDNMEYMELDEPEDGQVPRTENPEVLDETTDTEIGAGDQQQVPETLNLRRSSRVRKAPDRLCLPLDYILYTDSDCKLWTDSQSAIHLAKNSTFHSRTKHIQLRYHFIWSLLEDGQLNLEKIEGNKNPMDMLTKVVDRQKLSLCSTLISLR